MLDPNRSSLVASCWLLSRTNFRDKNVRNYTQDGLRAAVNATRIHIPMKLVSVFLFNQFPSRIIRFCRRTFWFPTSLSESIRIQDNCLPRQGREQVLTKRAGFKHFCTVRKQSKRILTNRIYSAISWDPKLERFSDLSLNHFDTHKLGSKNTSNLTTCDKKCNKYFVCRSLCSLRLSHRDGERRCKHGHLKGWIFYSQRITLAVGTFAGRVYFVSFGKTLLVFAPWTTQFKQILIQLKYSITFRLPSVTLRCFEPVLRWYNTLWLNYFLLFLYRPLLESLSS